MGFHSHTWSKNQLTTSFKGAVTLKDIFKSCDERVGDPRFDGIDFILNDYTEVDEIEGGFNETSDALTYSNQSKLFGGREDVLVAIVASKPSVRAKVELFLQLHEIKGHSWNRRCFDTIEDAEKWAAHTLKSPPTKIPQKSELP